MSESVPLPEPRLKDGFTIGGYAADEMHAHAAAVSAAKDAEITALRADLIKSLADNKALQEALDIAINWLHEDRCIFSRLKEVLRESGHE